MPMLSLALSAALTADIDPAALRALADVRVDDTTGIDVELPTGDATRAHFRMVDSHTLPPALMRSFPALRSYRGSDDEGRTARLDVSREAVHLSVREGTDVWNRRWTPGSPGAIDAPTPAASPVRSAIASGSTPARTRRRADAGNVRYDFRLAVAAGSRYTAHFGGTVEGGLTAVAHAVNQANEVFENDLGVHFTLAERNDRLILTQAGRDPFLRMDPVPASVGFIERRLGGSTYDMGHALLTISGGESESATSCSDDRSADFHATHKAAAWSGDETPDSPGAIALMIHMLARQLGAWPTANGCGQRTLPDRAFEPGSGSTALGFASTGCGGELHLQPSADRYFHAASIAQVRAWLAARGGRCATKRLGHASAPWVDPSTLAEDHVVPARTPFYLETKAWTGEPGRRLTYAWEQLDSGPEQRRTPVDDGRGPLFRSLPPTASPRRTFPRMAAVLGHAPAAPGETLPTTNRVMHFGLTVRDNGGDDGTVAGNELRLRVVDTGRPFAIATPTAATRATAGQPLAVSWDVAGTDAAPIDCHFVDVDLSVDGGQSWPVVLAHDEPNDGEATLALPAEVATQTARIRLRCDWRPFFAVSPGDFVIR